MSIELPFDSVEGIDLYKLTAPDGSPADPRVNNRDAENLVITHQVLDAQGFTNPFVIDENTGGVPAGIPPGTVYLYVFSHANCLLDGVSAWPSVPVTDLVACVNLISQ